MVGANARGVGGGLGAVALFATSLMPSPPPPELSPFDAIEIVPGGSGVLAPWDGSVECTWWNSSYYFSPGLCEPFSVSRIPTAMAQQAIERAITCAAMQEDVGCVLSGEIGFNVPAAFLYDSEQGFRMLLAPRLLPLEDDDNEEAEQRKVKVTDPPGNSPSVVFTLNTTVKTEFLTGSGRELKTETLSGSDAYCVQLLRASIVPACWESLD